MPEERDAYFRTSSGKALDNEYSADDLADWSEDEKLGHAGEAPFTRGNHASGYKGQLWTMRQYAGYATAAESNRRYRPLARARPERGLRRIRSSDPNRLRLGP